MKMKYFFLLLIVLMSCQKNRTPATEKQEIATVKKLWKLPEPFSGKLHVKDGYLYGRYGNRKLFKFQPRSGKLVWVFTSPAPLRYDPDFSNDYIYFVDVPGDLTMIDREGKLVFEGYYQWGEEPREPIAWKHRVYMVRKSGWELVLFDGRTKKLLWKMWASVVLSTPPVLIPGDRLLIGDSSGVLSAINTSDGTEIWKAEFPRAALSTPVLYKNNFYVGSGGYSLTAFDAHTLAKRWTYNCNYERFFSLAADDTSVYFHLKGGALVCLRHWGTGTATEHIIESPEGEFPVTGIVLYRGLMVWGTDGHNLCIVDTGKNFEMHKISLGSAIHEPIVCNNELFVAMTDGTICKINFNSEPLRSPVTGKNESL